MTAVRLVEVINANLQEMGSVVVLTTAASASQVVAALNAEFYGISGVTVLSTDMDAEDFVEALNSNFDLAGVRVKPQYELELADTISKVSELDNENGLVFALCTDIHYNPTEAVTNAGLAKVFDDSAVNMRAVVQDTGIDAVICLGDMIDGNTDLSRSESEAAKVITGLKSVGKPLYLALGNHDNNRNGNGTSYPVISRASMKTMFMDEQSQDVTFANSSYKSDYYKDYSAYSLRLIVIYGNAGTNGGYLYDTATRTFLQTSLANLPTGYKAIVITHVPPISKMNYNGAVRQGGENIPSGESVVSIKDIILNAGSKVIAMLYGHCHQDNVWADPFTSIGTCCNKGSDFNGSCDSWSEDAVMPLRTTANANADLWDVVLVKQTAKVIEMVRFGAGPDRTIHYEPVQCAARSSVTLTSKINGGTWGVRTSDQSKASVANGVVAVASGIASGTLISVWCKSSDWATEIVHYATTVGTAFKSRKLVAGSAVEYWTIKVV